MTPWYEKAREIMRRKNMNIRELSDKLGLTPGGAGHYLSGRRHPKPGMLRQIAKELNVSIAELVEDDPSFARDATESELLDLFRAVDDTAKAAALAMLRGLGKPRGSAGPVTNYSLQPASAGFFVPEKKRIQIVLTANDTFCMLLPSRAASPAQPAAHAQA